MQWKLTNDNKVLTLLSASELEIEQLKLTFEKESPNAKWDPRVKKGFWSGKINYFKAYKYLPAGLWYELVEMSKEYNFELKIAGIENKFDFDIDKDEFTDWVNEKWVDSPMKPRDYQIESAFNIIKYKNSLSEIATSAGKTLIIYMIIAYLLEQQKSYKVLMIVPSVDLVVQSTEDFYEYNASSVKYPLEVQQIYAGSTIRAKANVVVGTFQSLSKKTKEYFNEFDCVVVDECLHPNTLITMSDGSKKLITDIKAGDKVLTTNDKTLEIEEREVDFVYKNLSKNNQMFEIEMEDGNLIKITGNHKVKLTTGEYKRVDCLSEYDEILSI